MDDKKKLHITMVWIAIAVLSINQGIMAHQNHQTQQLLWNDLIRQTQIATKHLEEVNQFLHQYLEAH